MEKTKMRLIKDFLTKLSKDYGISIAKFQTIVNNARLYTQLRDDAKEIINF